MSELQQPIRRSLRIREQEKKKKEQIENELKLLGQRLDKVMNGLEKLKKENDQRTKMERI